MRWLAAVAAIAGASGALAQGPAPIDVMVVGTYHMDNPGLDLANMKVDDVLKPERQKELEALSAALADFRPTRGSLSSGSPRRPSYSTIATPNLRRGTSARAATSVTRSPTGSRIGFATSRFTRSTRMRVPVSRTTSRSTK